MQRANADRPGHAVYAARRKAGGIVLADGVKTRPVRVRSSERDVVLLHAMLGWATTVRLPNGVRLLDANPLAGVRREREPSDFARVEMKGHVLALISLVLAPIRLAGAEANDERLPG